MGREEQLLSETIKDSFADASKAEEKLGQILSSYSVGDQQDEDDEFDLAQDSLRWHVTKLYRDVGILAERMNLSRLASRIATEFDGLTQSDLAEMKHHPYDVDFYSPRLASVRAIFSSIAVMTDGTAVTSLDIFRTILQNTALILQQRGITPKNEAEVRQPVYDYLRIAFHDAVREIPVTHLFKTFKPDLGVRSLMAAAEFKFVETENELKLAVEGIFADMKGYRGSDWRTFFAVFYCTKAIANEKRFLAEFQDVEEDLSWTPIIVIGNGGRKLRAPRKT